MLDEVVSGFVCIDDFSCKALPSTASRGLRTKGVEVCRKLEGLIVRVIRNLIKIQGIIQERFN